MAREHRADHRPFHPGRRLTPFPIAVVDEGPWPGRLAFAPAPVGADAAEAIAQWGAATVLGLTTPTEAERLGWGDFATTLAAAGLRWENAPIEDFAVPDAAFESAWPAIRDRMVSSLDAGASLLVHCRGGRGRSGLVTATLLVAGGLAVEEAIALVRQVRPGAIETDAQEAWVRAQAGSPRATP